ncbi:MAG: ribosome assembly cofactor RimP [Spirochaetaceae bacterium]|jgi:ribosome maturation factor RimP|nr:ribosome assembly cofactor RimP [Spirochaetaceae bacterium]
MRYTPRVADKVFDSIEAVVKGLEMILVELSVSQQKGGVQVRAVVYRDAVQGTGGAGFGEGADRDDEETRFTGDANADGVAVCVVEAADCAEAASVTINDCARVHRAILPRLELAFPSQDIYIEVSSPGIERRIKDGAEFVHYIGRPVSCYRTDISGWTSGILISSDDAHIVIKGKDGMTSLSYDIIAKAKLAYPASIAQASQNPWRKKEAAV